MHRLTALIATALVVSGLAAASATAAPDETVIRVLEISNHAADHFVDQAGNDRPDAGDVFLTTSTLYAWKGVTRGARVGRIEIMCTFAGSGFAAAHCMATAFLPGGKLQLAGFVLFSESGTVVRVPIVGGTGRYSGAHGVFASRSFRHSDNSADVFRFTTS